MEQIYISIEFQTASGYYLRVELVISEILITTDYSKVIFVEKEICVQKAFTDNADVNCE